MSKVAAPNGLRVAGAKMWRDLVAKYDFRLDELALLERACRATDRIASMEVELGDRVTATGSMGQVVVHPLIPEIRAHSALVASLMRQLKLPDDGSDAGEAGQPNQQRAAAQSRWAAAHGASA